jgi:hypothetical protein
VDYGVDNRATQPTTLRLTCANGIHGLCTRKSRSRFGRRLSTDKSTGGTNLPVEKGCGQSVGPAFPQISNGPLITLGSPRWTEPRARENAGSSPAKRPAGPISVSYDSSVCSNTGDAVDRLAAAIDQLASDARGDSSDPELAERLAGLWQMVSDLDPELARRRQGYTALPGGATSE